VLDLNTRTAILRLHREGHSIRMIARTLRVSRNAVRTVLGSGRPEVPALKREEQLAPYLDRIRELHAACKGNQVRVHEELATEGIRTAYSTLTAFCRRHEIGLKPKKRSGRYYFDPGEEMQHDTSPHQVKVGRRERTLQCASLVLCYSRLRYAQCFGRWNRFHAKVFLTEALRYFGGAADECMVDNSNVVLLRGTGKNAEIAPEMEAFAHRFDFTFVAHEVGDANRSGRVERPFHHIENNFYPGRTFTDLDDLNDQFRTWCDTWNAAHNRWLKASPRELFAAEVSVLKPLPPYIPDVYDVHHRRVDTEGFVHLHTNAYSMDEALIGRQLVIHEHHRQIRVFDGHRLLQERDKKPYGAGRRDTLPEHRGRRKWDPGPPLPEETMLRTASPELAALASALRKRHGGRAVRAMRHLHRIYLDYPTEAVVSAVHRALEFGLLDLHRIERMVLEQIAGDFFRLPTREDNDG